MTLSNFRLIFFSAFLAIVLSPLAAWLASRIRLIDRPGVEPHKRHVNQRPLAGGLVIVTALAPIIWASGLYKISEIRAMLFAGAIVFIFGLWDDRARLPPLIKLVGQVLAAWLLVISGVHVRLFSNVLVDNLLTVLWIVGVTNAFNFVDSMDGLASGLAASTSGFFVLVAYDSNQFDLSAFSAVLFGLCCGVFFYTALPAYFFLGDSGAQFLGFVLAALAIAYNPIGFLPTQSWYVPVMLVGVPLFDMALVVISRLRRGKPIYLSGLDHTYHRLIKLGLHPNRAVVTMHFVAVMLGCLAFIALSLPPLWANLVFFSCLLIGIGGIVTFERWNHQS
jgi:UDP-GlcNAc:undecaprenyl-phosphate/decaprenyl-phosphate GlcNAc-1-phosphate transferase